jgi:Domain of unknown function (DUF4126)
VNAADAALFATQLAMGFALAACVGLRAFLPLLAAGLLARHGYVSLGPSFQWMESTPALVVFGSALVFEVLADKVPFLDHALHAVETFVKPMAATLLAASLFTNLDPVLAMTLGLIGGGTIAGAVQAVRGGARLLSTSVTGGLANPVLSLIDDGLAAVGVVFAILLPIFAAAVVVLLVIVGVRTLRGAGPGMRR